MKNLQSRTKVRLLQSFLLISLSLFFLAHPAYAQGGFAVKGVIVDKTGFPLPGANVMEKGTSNGTITDLDGNLIRVKAKELLAQAICHELDHLDGQLFVDKIIPGTLEYVEPEENK